MNHGEHLRLQIKVGFVEAEEARLDCLPKIGADTWLPILSRFLNFCFITFLKLDLAVGRVGIVQALLPSLTLRAKADNVVGP